MPVLSRTQQNDVYEIAQKMGLNPLDFDLTRAQPVTSELETFRHRPTQSHFEFGLVDDKIWLSWWPAFQPGKATLFAHGWANAVPTVVQWMRVVKANHDAPDLWAEARKAQQLTDAAGQTDGDNTPFTAAEIELIKPTLDEVETYIESRQPLDEEQKRVVRGRFQYVLGAAKRGLGRIDWINIFVSQMLQMFTEGVLHSSLYGDVMRHATTAFAAVLKLGAKLLGP